MSSPRSRLPENNQVIEQDEKDRALIKAFKSEDQTENGVLNGDYHPKAFKPELSRRLSDTSFMTGEAGLFRKSSSGKLIKVRITEAEAQPETTLRNSK